MYWVKCLCFNYLEQKSCLILLLAFYSGLKFLMFKKIDENAVNLVNEAESKTRGRRRLISYVFNIKMGKGEGKKVLVGWPNFRISVKRCPASKTKAANKKLKRLMWRFTRSRRLDKSFVLS